ncbi:MAG: hypothetical protein KKI02_00795, partial [Planctomycetes bacterium]|nr:hypothetical protein [Planctomycetota bacterium]
PVGRISPGSLGADFAPDAVAVIWTATTEGAASTGELAYEGNPLISGSTFSCGDVIEIRFSQTGPTDAPVFSVSVRVIPGQ